MPGVGLLDIKEGLQKVKKRGTMQTAALLWVLIPVSLAAQTIIQNRRRCGCYYFRACHANQGMTREELIGHQCWNCKGVAENILKYSPDTIIIVISNPMDTMTYLALQAKGLPKNRNYWYGWHTRQLPL